MNDVAKEWIEVLGQVGLGGFAIFALMRVWDRLIIQSDTHRVEASDREEAHRIEMASKEEAHRAAFRESEKRHRDELSELVHRNMDEHRERNRVQTMLAMAVASSFAAAGKTPPDPYPNIDKSGRLDPRPKDD